MFVLPLIIINPAYIFYHSSTFRLLENLYAHVNYMTIKARAYRLKTLSLKIHSFVQWHIRITNTMLLGYTVRIFFFNFFASVWLFPGAVLDRLFYSAATLMAFFVFLKEDPRYYYVSANNGPLLEASRAWATHKLAPTGDLAVYDPAFHVRISNDMTYRMSRKNVPSSFTKIFWEILHKLACYFRIKLL